MDIKYEVKDGYAVFYFEKYIDIFNSEKIKYYLMGTIEKNNHTKVIFNFEKLEELDSIGIAMLIKVFGALRDKVQIRFCNIHNNVEKSLKYSYLQNFFNIDDTEDASMQKLLQG